MPRNGILVVCYSRGGTTLRVARHIADALSADFERIEEPSSREGLGGYARSALEALARGLPTIRTQKDPRDYALVVVGTPVWVGTMASPVRSYLARHARTLQNAAFFAVMAGRGAEDTVQEMKFACGVPEAPTCVFTQREVQYDRFRRRCADFIRALHGQLAQPEVFARTPPAA
jgi:flavodoxin